MNSLKITYWVTTAIVVLGMLVYVINYFFNLALKVAFVHIGFPDWFRVELAIAKLLGALALDISAVPARVIEWPYVGFSSIFFPLSWRISRWAILYSICSHRCYR